MQMRQGAEEGAEQQPDAGEAGGWGASRAAAGCRCGRGLRREQSRSRVQVRQGAGEGAEQQPDAGEAGGWGGSRAAAGCS